MRTYAIVALLPFVAGLGACAGPSRVSDLPNEPVSVQRFQPESTAYTYYSGLDRAERLVIRDQAAWSDVWQAIHATRTPVPDLPAVDFAREMVIAAALGQRPTGGYDIVIEEAVPEADALRVQLRSVRPGPGCMLTQALTQPVDIARVPRHDGEVRFDERTEVRDCS